METLRELGAVAGIGGLALGTFLLLFKRIQLPKAGRRQLTLFMWLVWSACILGLLCYSLPPLLAAPRPQDLPSFSGNIPITYPNHADARPFATFLHDNHGSIVLLQSNISMDVSNEESMAILERYGIDIPANDDRNNVRRITLDERFRRDSSTPLPLDGLDGFTTLHLRLLNARQLPESNGGTGCIAFPLHGHFRVTMTGGSSRTSYELLEIQETAVVR